MAQRGEWSKTQPIIGYSDTYTRSFWRDPPSSPDINTAKYASGPVTKVTGSWPAMQGYRARLRKGNMVVPLPTHAGMITFGKPTVYRRTFYPPIFGQSKHPETTTNGFSPSSGYIFTSCSSPVVGYRWQNLTNSDNYDPLVTVTVPPSEQAFIQNAILAKLGNSAMQLQVTLAEYRKTAATLVQSTNRLIGAAFEIASGKPDKYMRELGIVGFGEHPDRVYYRDRRGRKKVSRVWKREKDSITLINDSVANMSQRYLEARFGLMPVLYDIDGASRIIAGWDRNKILGRMRHVHVVPLDHSRDDKANYMQQTMSGTLKLTHRFTFHMRDSFANEMNSIGMDITHLLNTAWELIPYTWLLDKFTNIGDYTLALSGARAWQFDYGSLSMKVDAEVRTVVNIDLPLLIEKASSTFTINSFQRNVLSSFPLPMIPRIRADLGLRDYADILTLGLTKIRGISSNLIK